MAEDVAVHGSDTVQRGLVVAAGLAGVLLSGATAQLGRIHQHEHELSAAGGRLILAGSVMVAVVAFLAVLRPVHEVARTSGAHALRLGGLAAVYAGLLLVGAAWSPTFAVAVTLQLLAAVAIGIHTAATAVVLTRLAGAPTAAAITVTGLGLGLVVGVVGPVAMNGVSEFGHLRKWLFHRPHTVPGMRATLLFSAVAGFAAASRVGAVGRTIADRPIDRRVGAAAARSVVRPRRRPGAPLEISGLDLSYGQLQVLFGVDLHVDEGETVALLGTNGAGKSSVLRAAFGLHAPSAGRVWSGDRDITGWSAERLARDGLLQVPGGKGVFPSLSVRENLRMAAYPLPGARRVREGIDRAVEAFPRLRERLDQPAGVLSGGEQQMVALARAWINRPKLLAIDELSLGLAPIVIGELKAFVRLLREEGVPIIIVEQSVYTAFDLCERAYFLERGQVRFEGRTEDLLSRTDLLRSIFFEASAS